MASGPASTMPKGAAANLASGGMPPVATCSGKLAALASVRPVSSRSAAGSARLRRLFSGSGAAKRTSLSVALRSSASTLAAMALPCAGASVAASANARGTGAEKRSSTGRSGRHGALARSRSQLISALKRARTVHAKLRGVVVTSVDGAAAAMPAPHTMRMRVAAGSGRSQATSSQRWASPCRPRVRINSSRTAPCTRRSGTRSPRPSTSHQALRCTLARSTAPLLRKRKCWSSSTGEPA